MHSRLKYFISAFLLITISCKQQSEREQITDTTKKILQSIQENRESDFLNLIGVPLKVLGKSNSMVHSDFEKIKVRFKEHNLDPTIQINDTPNYMGQKLVPIFKILDTLSNGSITSFNFSLLFGPPNINSLDKISGYELRYTDIKAPTPNNIFAP